MDVKNFQDSRNTELEAFKKQYSFLKTHYSTALSSAINEPDPAKQQTLISQIQQINSQLSNELHGILSTLNKGHAKFDPKQLDDLTNDLIQYQKDYDDIEKSKDKVSTLKIIANTNASTLKNATIMYYIYISILVIISLYVGYLIVKTSWKQSVKQIMSTIQTVQG
jgi:DNA repair exonuclease SbcCD ATPase subunit